MKALLLLSLATFTLGLSSCANCCKKKPADCTKCASCDTKKM